MYSYFDIDERLKKLSDKAEQKAVAAFERIEAVKRYNQQKMLAAFSKAEVSESHFVASTGYGYGDRGRDVLDEVFANAFECEDALVRHNFVSGTHTLTVALFGMLRPGDTMLSVTGTPYDTIHGVIGIKPASGSLAEFGVGYEEVGLSEDGTIDFEAIESVDFSKYRMVYLQRSRGYSLRPSFFCEEIGRVAEIVHRKSPDTIVMVDNCYGEFVETTEPVNHGADIMAGSLIKNPGGGIAPTGGYIAGKKELVEMCSYRLTTPDTGREIGATLGNNRELFMGAFSAPTVVGEALKTAAFAASLFSEMGYAVTPTADEARTDIIQAIMLGNAEALTAFCTGIQHGAPVDSFVTPIADDMPGYDSQVIMAAGAFTLGASIELSADAPLREPFAVWLQGALNYNSGQLGVLLAAQEMLNAGQLDTSRL